MNTWVLILFTFIGPLSDKESQAITNVPGFKTVADCETAGQTAKNLVKGSLSRDLKYVCVKQ